MKKKKECGCKDNKYRGMKVKGMRECYNNKTNELGLFEAYSFQQNKPFRVSFNEDIDVDWKNKENLQEKKLTKKDVKQREEMVMKLKKNMKGMKEKYGKRAKGVMYAIATNYAKKKP